MIFTETREGRRFVGDLDPGTPLVQHLTGLAKTHRISSAEIRASGWLQGVRLRAFVPGQGLGEPVATEGIVHVVGLHGSVSLTAEQPVVVLHAALFALDSGASRHGVIVEAEVVSLEVLVETFDDVTLHRIRDRKSGLERWLDLTIHEGSALGSGPESVRSGREAMEAMPSRLLDEDLQYDLRMGDYLEHPRLGRCEVIQVIDDDRIAIRLDSGRIAQLHLGLLRLTRQGRAGARQVFSVEVRRRQ
jgi:predicted DNA-binding protein with PD1-like motif